MLRSFPHALPGVQGRHSPQVGCGAEGKAAVPCSIGAKLGLGLVSLPLSSHGLLKMMERIKSKQSFCKLGGG